MGEREPYLATRSEVDAVLVRIGILVKQYDKLSRGAIDERAVCSVQSLVDALEDAETLIADEVGTADVVA